MKATAQTITGWVFFHYIQIEEGVWALEITLDDVNGNVYLVEHNVKAVDLRNMTYRDGWSNGFLLYNNQGRRPAGEITKVYATEIRAISK